MDTLLISILVIALVCSNVFWLVFLSRLLKDERSERWQLQERIREPETEHIPIGHLIKDAHTKPPSPSPADPIFTEENPEDEFALVGQIDPDTPLRSDEDIPSEDDE